ncbi:MAG: riboflavin synthase [Actinobacteria bacterium]|nr:riboflavin synthase [Actinomycetota bacterium]MBW3649559.1 riboflavin synthase [Actinomycetota bacterium]
MFTGIVEELGRVRSRDGGRFTFEAREVVDGTSVGDSIAVNGCCLTATEVGAGWWGAEAVEETLARTNLSELAPGDAVNLERPVRLVDRLGGHIVQGHVDGIGEVVRPAPLLQVRMPAELTRYVVQKGSITVDGCSLTVVEVLHDGFTVAIIPHTARVTTLGRRQPGEHVNLEVDLLAKYLERLVEDRLPDALR